MGVIKPDVDFKNYRFVELDSKLQVMLISSLKPGETPDNMHDISESESEESSGSGSEQEEINDSEMNQSSEAHGTSSTLRKSAAALCIHVGSYSDPLEAQGLAHFLEHMVFMGSEKYPRENDFDDYVSQRDGRSNAHTESEYTIFYFDIQGRHFKSALDKFANFFIAPLLSLNCVDRELEAVHSEFELCKADDHWRLNHLLYSLAKPDTPVGKFNLGNRISLKENPCAAGTNVYEILRNFQQQYYNAPLMTLAVESKDTLEHLEKLVSDIFKDLPRRIYEKPNFKQFMEPYPASAYNKIYKVCPIKEMASLNFTWSLPPMRAFYRAAPLSFLGAIIGHEGRGSLLAYLRDRNLAVELCAGTATSSSTQNNQIMSLFSITVDLSELGRGSPFTVATHVFAYLKMLTAAADYSLQNPLAATDPSGDRTFASLIPEHQQLWASQFRFQEPFEPCETVQHVATAMLNYPPDEVYVADHLMLQPELAIYVDLVHRLTPQTALIALTLPEFTREARDDKTRALYLTEPWFDIQYAVEDLSADQMKNLQNPPNVSEFHLPEINCFVATNFDLLPREDDNEVPRDLNLEAGRENARTFGQLWHQQRTKFNVPIGNVTVRLCSDFPYLPKHRALLSLWCCALDQRLQTLVYSASQAGLHYSVSMARHGLQLHVAGFNEKLYLLYQNIIDLLNAPLMDSEAGVLITPQKFTTYKDRLRQKTCNRILNPSKLNLWIRKYMIDSTECLVDEYMKSLEEITLEELVHFTHSIFANLSVKAFVYGNISKNEALAYFDYTLSTLKFSNPILLNPPSTPTFPVGLNRFRVMNFNKSDVNTSLSLVAPLRGTPPSGDLRLEVLNELIGFILEEPAFAYLRTTETLGYIVSFSSWCLSEVKRQCGLTLIVCSQANKFDSCLVAGRMYAFWYRLVPQIILRLKSHGFQTAVNALIASNRLEDTTMEVEVHRNLKEIFSEHPQFDQREKAIAILKNLSLKDLQEFFQVYYFDHARQSLLMVQVDSAVTDQPRSGNDVDDLKSFDWPVVSVPVSEAQVTMEKESSATVDVIAALKACAPGLIDQNGELVETCKEPPAILEISDLRLFKATFTA